MEIVKTILMQVSVCQHTHCLIMNMEQSLSFSTVALVTGSGKNHKEYEAPDL